MRPRSVELYFIPHSCARVALIALEEIGVPYELHPLNRSAGENKAPKFLALNPKGKVPTLVVAGRVLTENPAIFSYLARTFPEAHLLPEEDEVALDALSTMCWFASSFHPIIGTTRFPMLASDDPGCLRGIRAKGLERLTDAFTLLEERLDGREWLYDEWSIVDAYQFWLWFRATGMGMDASSFPRCARNAEAIVERPSVRRALECEAAEVERQEAQGASFAMPAV